MLDGVDGFQDDDFLGNEVMGLRLHAHASGFQRLLQSIELRIQPFGLPHATRKVRRASSSASPATGRGSPGLGRISSGRSGIALAYWRRRTIRRRHALTPLLQPFPDDGAYVAVRKMQHVVPLHIQTELFQLGETQAGEASGQRGR